MNRRGLWAAGVVLILLVVGAGVLTVGAGYAKGENTANPDYSRSRVSLMNTGNVILSGRSQCAGF
jgi:hypothetical protein